MSLPALPFTGISAIAERWSCKPLDIVAWAVAGHLKLALPLPPVETAPGRFVSGLVEIDAAECYRLFRENPLETIVIHRVRPIDRPDWEIITEPTCGVRISRLDVVITAGDIERIEKRPGTAPATDAPAPPTPEDRKNRGRPQGTSQHDWVAFNAYLVRFIHDRGVPKSLADLCRDMETWFRDQDPDNVPDISTIRKKLQPVWAELKAA